MIAGLLFIVFYNTPYSIMRMKYYPSKLFNFLDILIFSQIPALLAYFIFSLSVYYIQSGFSLGITFKLTLKSFQTKSVFVILLLAIISSLLFVVVDIIEDNVRHSAYDKINTSYLDSMYNPSSEPVNGLSSDVDINELINQNSNQEAVEPIAPKVYRIPFWILGLESFVKSLFFVFVFIYSAIIASKTLESNSIISSDKNSNEVSF